MEQCTVEQNILEQNIEEYNRVELYIEEWNGIEVYSRIKQNRIENRRIEWSYRII